MASRLRTSSNRVQEGFKKTVDLEESRKAREKVSVELRKNKKDEQLLKKRRDGLDNANSLQDGVNSGTGDDGRNNNGNQNMNNNNNNNNSNNNNNGGTFTSNGYSSGPTPTTRKASVLAALAELPQLVAQVYSNDLQTQYQAAIRFRKMLSTEKNPPIDEVIRVGVVPKFVEFLQYQHCPELQFEAAWALTNIASGASDQTKVVIEADAVKYFVQLLLSPNEEVREQAVWALGNIAGDSVIYRDHVLKANALPPLLMQLNENSKLTMLRNSTWALSNFCRGKPPPALHVVQPALPVLAKLIYSSDEDVLADACWALSYLSDGPSERINAVLEQRVARKMVELLIHQAPTVQTAALRTVGNIVTGNDEQTQVIINCGALPCLLHLLGINRKNIKKEACWTISNITAGNKDQIQAVINAGIIPPLVSVLQSSDFDIKKEAAWAISNATSCGSPDQIRILVSHNCIKPLCDLLVAPDSRVITVALEGLENILKVGALDEKIYGYNPFVRLIEEAEGLKKIDDLQDHSNHDIYQRAVKVLETYFAATDVDQNIAPNVDASGNVYQFGFNASNPMMMMGNNPMMMGNNNNAINNNNNMVNGNNVNNPNMMMMMMNNNNGGNNNSNGMAGNGNFIPNMFQGGFSYNFQN